MMFSLFWVLMSHENLKHIQSKVWVCAHQSRLCWSKPSGTNYWMISLIDMTVSWLRNTTFCLLHTRSRPFQLPSCFGAVLLLLSFTLCLFNSWECACCNMNLSYILEVSPQAFAVFCCSVLPPGGYSQDNCGSVASFLRSAASSSGLPRDLDDVTIPDFPDVSGFLHMIKDAAMVWARCLLGGCFGFIPFQCIWRCREAWSHSVFVWSWRRPAFVTRLSLKCVFNTRPVVLCLTNCLLSKPCFLISVLKKLKIECVACHSSYLHVVLNQMKSVALPNMLMSWEQFWGLIQLLLFLQDTMLNLPISAVQPVVTILSPLGHSLRQPVCSDCLLFVSTGGGQRLSREGRRKALSNSVPFVRGGGDVKEDIFLFIVPPQGSRAASALTAGTLTSLGGTSSRRGSCETAVTLDAETSLREIKVTETSPDRETACILRVSVFKEAAERFMEVIQKMFLCELCALTFLQTPVLLFSSPNFLRHLLWRCHVAALLCCRCCLCCCFTLHQEIHELKDQIQDVEIKYTQNLKEAKV